MYFPFEGIDIRVVHRANARRLRMTARPGADYVSLTVPPYARSEDVMRFLSDNREWLHSVAPDKRLFQARFEAGEDHALLGERVILGRDGMPCGPAFIHYRQARLEEEVKRLSGLWLPVMSVPIRTIRFREMVSQWGSCIPSKGTVTLARNLGMVPVRCVEYVLIHEFCHMFYANHSRDFYATVQRYLPDWKERKDCLAKFDLRPRPQAV